MKNYLEFAIETVGSDPETESEGGYDWGLNHTIKDFDNETISQAKKDIIWFLNKTTPIIKKYNLDDSEIANGIVASRSTGSPDFWELPVSLANKLTKIALELGYIDIIKNTNGKLKIIKI